MGVGYGSTTRGTLNCHMWVKGCSSSTYSCREPLCHHLVILYFMRYIDCRRRMDTSSILLTHRSLHSWMWFWSRFVCSFIPSVKGTSAITRPDTTILCRYDPYVDVVTFLAQLYEARFISCYWDVSVNMLSFSEIGWCISTFCLCLNLYKSYLNSGSGRWELQ